MKQPFQSKQKHHFLILAPNINKKKTNLLRIGDASFDRLINVILTHSERSVAFEGVKCVGQTPLISEVINIKTLIL